MLIVMDFAKLKNVVIIKQTQQQIHYVKHSYPIEDV